MTSHCISIARDADVPKLSRPLGLPGPRNEFVEGIKTVAREERIFVNIGVHELPQMPQTSSDNEVDPSAPDRCYNTNIVVSDEGEILSTYRKVWFPCSISCPSLGGSSRSRDFHGSTMFRRLQMHLFNVDLAPAGPTLKESDTTSPGTSLSIPVQTPVGSLGVSHRHR